MVATDCKTYAIMNVVFRKGGKAHSVLKLYSEPTGGIFTSALSQPREGAGEGSEVDGMGGTGRERDRTGRGMG